MCTVEADAGGVTPIMPKILIGTFSPLLIQLRQAPWRKNREFSNWGTREIETT
jgi:hypothetical protein